MKLAIHEKIVKSIPMFEIALQMITCMEQSFNMDLKLHAILKPIIACYI